MKDNFLETIENVGEFIVTINGKREVIIENHKGIIELSDNKARIKTKIGVIEINGKDFEIIYIGECTIAIKAKIKSIFIEETNND